MANTIIATSDLNSCSISSARMVDVVGLMKKVEKQQRTSVSRKAAKRAKKDDDECLSQAIGF